MSEQADRITISREALRADLAELELRLVDRLGKALEVKADSMHVIQLEARVQSLELSKAAREGLPAEVLDLNKRVGALEKFRYAVPSVSILSLFASISLLLFYIAGGHP